MIERLLQCKHIYKNGKGSRIPIDHVVSVYKCTRFISSKYFN